MGYWPVVKKVLKDADIVVFVLDARMPEFSRNNELERLVRRYKKELVRVFNKIDLVSPSYLKNLKRDYAGFFVSGNRNVGLEVLRRNLHIIAKRKGLEVPVIGVVGYPNVGKSSIINALGRRARAKTGKFAGTTRGIQFINVSGMKVLDSPGVIPFEDGSVKLALLGAKDSEKLKFPEKAAYELLKLFVKRGKLENVEKAYKCDLGDDVGSMLEEIGRKRGFLGKGGVVDERKAAIHFLRDWHQGKFGF